MGNEGRSTGRWLVSMIAMILAITIGLHASLANDRPGSRPIPIALQTLLDSAPATHVLLPDGRVLTLTNSDVVLESLDADAKHTTNPTQHIHLPQIRRFATATVMPDGHVLIWGGADASGNVVNSGLWFDPSKNSLSAANGVALSPRAGQAAALLRDGRLLVTGGWSPTLGSTPEAELFDLRNGHVQAISGYQPVSGIGQTAVLSVDGQVELLGGVDLKGRPITVLTVFNPMTQQFSVAPISRVVTQDIVIAGPSLRASIPMQNASNFPSDGVLALHFSVPMDVRTINSKTIILVGPGGSTSTKVVAAQGGKLAFITPTSDLFPGAHYTLFLQGAMSKLEASLPFTAIDFSVAVQQTEALHNPVFSHEVDQSTTTSSTTQLVGNGASSVTTTVQSMQPLRLMTGEASQSISKAYPCGIPNQSIAELCRAKSYTEQGAWYPGRDAGGEVHGGHWRLNKPDITPQEIAYAALMLRVQGGSGPTGINGRIELVDGQAIANVDVSIGTTHVRTNARGDFDLTGVPAGRQWLYVDGTTANTAGHEYGQFVVGFNVRKGVDLPLSYRMYLPRILARDKIEIPSPTKQDLVVTHPDMPGLEIHIPAGTVIKDHKGKVVTELAIVPTPVDRAPFPTAQNFPVYFSIEPAGATVQNINPKGQQGIQIVYPNYSHIPAGTETDFYVYHPDDDWKVYGKGHVTADGAQIVPESGVNLVWVMGGSFYLSNSHPGDTPQTVECGTCGGDPVDLWSDTLEESQEDIHISDVIPISLSRLFHTNSLANESRAFGSWRSNYDIYLYSSNGNYASPSIRLPDGNLVQFTQITAPSGDEYEWTAPASPTPWDKAILEAAFAPSALSNRCGGATECYLLTLKDGTQFQFEDSFSSQLTFIRDRFGNQISLTYSGGILQQITSPSGRYISLTYNSNNNIATATDNTGRTWIYSYTGQTNSGSPAVTWQSLDSVTYPDTTTWHYNYNTNASVGNWGTLQSVIDRNGHAVVTNSYTQLSGGQTGPYTEFYVSSQVLADNTNYTFVRSALGSGTQEMDVTDPNGNLRKVVMDPATGYPVSVTEAAGTPLAEVSTYTRDGNGLIHSMIDPLLRQTNYGYNTEGDVTSVTRLFGTSSAVTQQFTYTPDYHQIATYVDGLGHTTTFTYTNGCLTGVKDPLSHSTTIVCNGYGQPTSIKDALGHATTLGYRGYDLLSLTDALGRKVTYTTDSLGRIVTASDPLGNVTLRQYDLNDNVDKLTDPFNQVTTPVFDPMGNLKSVTLPNTGIINYVYDSRNRLRQRIDALTQSESWTPDAMGNVVSYIVRKGQATTYQYDALDRRKLTTYADGSTIVPTYDAGDRVNELSDSVSGNLNFQYDGLDRLQQAITPQATVVYNYDAANRRTTMTAGTQAQVVYTYDNANRITGVTQGSEVVQLGYDNANRRNSLTLPNGVVVAYGYDNANQLTGITYTQGSGTTIGNLVYGYDNDGRRTAQTGTMAPNALPTATTQASTFDLNNRVATFNGNTQTYDADGNLTFDGTNTYVWNARNQLTQVMQGSAVIADYSYDAVGRRMSRAVNGSTPTTFLYDGLNPVQETQGTTATPILTGLGVDEFYARTEPTGRTYFLADAVGSTIGLTSTTGALVQSYQYDPYGEVTAQNSGFTNPYQYTGRENDGDGLYYYRARYYSPLMKRFVGEDPIGFGGGQSNFYAYAGGNPTYFTDPTGKFIPEAIIGGVLGGAFGAITGYISGDRGSQLLEDTISGGASGLLIGLTDGLSLASSAAIDVGAKVAIGAGIGSGMEAVRQLSNYGCIKSPIDVAISGAFGAAGAGAGGSSLKALGNQLEGAAAYGVAGVGGLSAGAMQTQIAVNEAKRSESCGCNKK